MFPASMLPAALRTAGYVIPSTHAVQAFSGLAYGMKVDFSALLPLMILTGIAIAAMVTAMFKFRAACKV